MLQLANSKDIEGKLRHGRSDLDLQRTLLGEAIDEAPVLVFVADDEGHYIAVNRQACETLGYSRRDLLGMTVPEVAVAPEAPELYETMLREGRLEGTTPIRCNDGRLLTFRYWAKVVKVGGVDLWTSVGVVEPTTPPEDAPEDAA